MALSYFEVDCLAKSISLLFGKLFLCIISLGAKHLIWVLIMKVKGPKNKQILLKYYMW